MQAETSRVAFVRRCGLGCRDGDELPASTASIGELMGPRQISESIGPWQIADHTLWFAKKFYSGEDWTGFGRFGYFDTELRRYRMWSPKEASSATAMLVEPEAVLAGSCNRRRVSHQQRRLTTI